MKNGTVFQRNHVDDQDKTIIGPIEYDEDPGPILIPAALALIVMFGIMGLLIFWVL